MQCLVTAVTSPVGRKVATELLRAGHQVVGVAEAGWQAAQCSKMTKLLQHVGFALSTIDLCSRTAVMGLFARYQPATVLHLGGRGGLCSVGQSSPRCVDMPQRMMLNLLDASVQWQSQHFSYCQTAALYDNSREGRYRHQASLHQVEVQQQLCAHTYSLLYQLKTSGVCFTAREQALHTTPQQYGEDGGSDGYFDSYDVQAITQQLVQLLLDGRQLPQTSNACFTVYQAVTTTRCVSWYPVRSVQALGWLLNQR